MRRVLLSGLEGTVSYNKEVKSYCSTPDKVEVKFADGTSAEGSFLVGTDGLRSSIARQLTSGKAEVLDMGVPMIYGKTILTSEVEARIHPYMRKGMSVFRDTAVGPPRTLFVEPMRFNHDTDTQDYIYWVLSGYGILDDRSIEEGPKMQGDEAAAATLRATKDWRPDIRALLEAQDPSQTASLRMTTSNPSGLPTWETDARVTVLGDAIHCMPPTGGSGANTALRDASLLMDMFVKGRTGVTKEMVQAYERQMREWANKAVAMSCEAAVHGFGVRPLTQTGKVNEEGGFVSGSISS